ncbi:hypothetical protein WUBG_05347, partial [Wuchereria bancrofti]
NTSKRVSNPSTDEVRTIKPKDKTATSKDTINKTDKREESIAQRTRSATIGKNIQVTSNTNSNTGVM